MVSSPKKIQARVATRPLMNSLPSKFMMVHLDKLIEHNHCDIESWYNSNADSRWKTQIKVIPFAFWQNNFLQNSIIFPWSFQERKFY